MTLTGLTSAWLHPKSPESQRRHCPVRIQSRRVGASSLIAILVISSPQSKLSLLVRLVWGPQRHGMQNLLTKLYPQKRHLTTLTNQADGKRRSVAAKLTMLLPLPSVKLPSAVEPLDRNPKMATTNGIGRNDDPRMMTMSMTANTRVSTALSHISTIPRQQARKRRGATRPAYLGTSLAAASPMVEQILFSTDRQRKTTMQENGVTRSLAAVA